MTNKENIGPKMDESLDEPPLILVVEDDDDYRWLIASKLKEDYLVTEAANGSEGLEKAMETIPDLIVTDVMMPVMDGVELCRHLKKEMETAHIPVVMLTARTSEESQIEGLETGADDYVTKPFSMRVFKTRVHNLLETRRLLSERFYQRFTQSAKALGGAGSDMPEMLESGTRLDREFWDDLCRILREKYADSDFKIVSLASDFNMSPRTMQRKIKALMDLTPVQLVAQYRLKKAETLLLDPDVHVKDIAFMVGYRDLSHFYRLFKKKHGVNPSQYRNENGQSSYNGRK